ncbi:MAG: alpha/beta hydrolase [Betaproteobacteria bacterium]|nr:alpha/beta hydrolase [Betaproteobacteria bacterium]
MKSSDSLYLPIRGLRYHVRRWGRDGAPKLILLHGWMDVSASFQFLVDALKGDWQVLAPDWRGYGLTDWSGQDAYWFPDYIADLHLLLRHIEPDRPATVIAHSMGGNVAGLYAGVRPERISRMVNLEGFGLPGTDADQAPKRYSRWLSELQEHSGFRDYDSYEALAERLMKNNPRLSRDRAVFLAGHWGQEIAESGRVTLRSDPAHRRVNAVLYRVDEALACWRNITARVLWVEGEESDLHKHMRLSADALAERKHCIPKMVEYTISGAGHMIHHDQPELLADTIERYLAETPA